jgi:hypothetical protein
VRERREPRQDPPHRVRPLCGEDGGRHRGCRPPA